MVAVLIFAYTLIEVHELVYSSLFRIQLQISLQRLHKPISFNVYPTTRMEDIPY